MKKYIVLSLFILLFTGSCEKYLDRSPDAGITNNEVFEKYANFKLFFDAVYDGRETSDNRHVNIRCAYPLWIAFWDQKTSFDALTEIADHGRALRTYWSQGTMGQDITMLTTDRNRRPVLKAMFVVIRICNITIANVDRIKDASEEEKDDIRAQAYFFRGYAHFNLIRFWGPMPYINFVINEDPENWDLPRASKNQSLRNVGFDMDSAYMFFEKAGKVRRDPGPGETGHLDDPDQHRPSGISAKAIKARALLYAASPLNNEHGAQDWIDAAEANWEAIQLAHQYQYDLLPMDKYDENYLQRYSNEQLFAWYYGNGSRYDAGDFQGLMSGAMADKPSSFSGECPSQNMVDKFEVIYNGTAYALNTESDRAYATGAGAYNEQDPFVNRDPRFYNAVIYNQAPIVWTAHQNKAQIWYKMDGGKPVYSAHADVGKYQGCTRTGYYSKKHLGDMSAGNPNLRPYVTDPIIRLGELYLNYAEAANEAYGPTGAYPGAITAEAALNVIRNRATLPDIDPKYLASTEALRERIKNERTVEFCFEGFHHYFDIRRWMDAPKAMTEGVYGMVAEQVGVSAAYPTGFRYERKLLAEERQRKWKNEMYYLPFDESDYYKMKNFDTSLNPRW